MTNLSPQLYLVVLNSILSLQFLVCWLLLLVRNSFSDLHSNFQKLLFRYGSSDQHMGIFRALRQFKCTCVLVDGCNPLTFIVISRTDGFLSSRRVRFLLLSILCGCWSLLILSQAPLCNPIHSEVRFWSSGGCPDIFNVGTSPLQ